MASDSGEIVDRAGQLHKDFRVLVDMVTGPTATEATAARMELSIFREVLALGRRLLELYFVMRAAKEPVAPLAADGTPMTEWRRRPVTYLSVFGKIRFQRHRYYAPGQCGVSPLDAELSLPQRCYSPVLCDWIEYDVADAAYDQSAQTIKRILGVDISKHALETLVGEDSLDVDAFYRQKPTLAPEEEGPILVVQADGSGVRLLGTEPSERTGHATSKREAVVTSVYSIGRHVRTPQAVAAALMRESEAGGDAGPQPARPEPLGKETRATMNGKDAAFDQFRPRVARRDGPHIADRVALTDGAESLQERMASHFPNFALVLDIIHPLGYLWAAAAALYDHPKPDTYRGYVSIQLERLLAGQTQVVIDDLVRFADQERLAGQQRKPVDDAVRYFTRNAPFMHYHLYLARGWPIATGVIEGACKDLVKSRTARSGMRWSRPGAHAILQLRAVRINADWDDYQRFRRAKEHQRLYGPSDHSIPPEAQVLDRVA